MYRTELTILLAAVLLVPAGCQKGLPESGAEGGSPADADKFTATIVREDSKLGLNADDYVCWNDEDQVLVKGSSVSAMTVASFGSDAMNAVLEGSVPAAAGSGYKYTGYFPGVTYSASAGWGWNTTDNKIVLPETRAWNTRGTLGWYPMIAFSNTKHLEFRSLFGLLEINLTCSATVSKLELSTNGNQMLSGTFNAGGTYDTDAGDGSSKIVITGLGDCTRGKKVYIAVPPATYSTLTIEVYSTDDYACTQAKNVVIGKGTVYESKVTVSHTAGVQLWAGGPLWKAKDLGACSNVDYGVLFQWGSTERIYGYAGMTVSDNAVIPIDDGDYSGGFTWATYKKVDGDGTGGNFTKYTTAKQELEIADDAARKYLGSTWRIPTHDQWVALSENCYTRYVTDYPSEKGAVCGVVIWGAKDASDKKKYDKTAGSYTNVGTYSYADAHIFMPFHSDLDKKTTKGLWAEGKTSYAPSSSTYYFCNVYWTRNVYSKAADIAMGERIWIASNVTYIYPNDGCNKCEGLRIIAIKE